MFRTYLPRNFAQGRQAQPVGRGAGAASGHKAGPLSQFLCMPSPSLLCSCALGSLEVQHSSLLNVLFSAILLSLPEMLGEPNLACLAVASEAVSQPGRFADHSHINFHCADSLQPGPF